MKTISRLGMILMLLSGLLVQAGEIAPQVDLEMVARIREEGLQRSQVADITSYMTDVLGARLTLSQDMKRAQAWAAEKMRELGSNRSWIMG